MFTKYNCETAWLINTLLGKLATTTRQHGFGKKNDYNAVPIELIGITFQSKLP